MKSKALLGRVKGYTVIAFSCVSVCLSVRNKSCSMKDEKKYIGENILLHKKKCNSVYMNIYACVYLSIQFFLKSELKDFEN